MCFTVACICLFGHRPPKTVLGIFISSLPIYPPPFFLSTECNTKTLPVLKPGKTTSFCNLPKTQINPLFATTTSNTSFSPSLYTMRRAHQCDPLHPTFFHASLSEFKNSTLQFNTMMSPLAGGNALHQPSGHKFVMPFFWSLRSHVSSLFCFVHHKYYAPVWESQFNLLTVYAAHSLSPGL